MLSSTCKEESALNRGFTLLELLIVLAIIGLLSAVAYSSYQYLLLKARRLDAQTTLLHYHTQMQKCFITTYNYKACATQLNLSEQQNSFENFYRVQAITTDTHMFTLEASAQGIQEEDEMCYKFTINHLLQKQTYDVAGNESNFCW